MVNIKCEYGVSSEKLKLVYVKVYYNNLYVSAIYVCAICSGCVDSRYDEHLLLFCLFSLRTIQTFFPLSYFPPTRLSVSKKAENTFKENRILRGEY